MVLRTRCALALSSGAADALVKDGGCFKQLQAVLEFIYLMACVLLEVAAS